MSPISAARVSASRSPTPGIVTSSATSRSARAIGVSSCSSGAIRSSRQFDHRERLLDRALPDRRHAASREQLEPALRAAARRSNAAPTASQAVDTIHRRGAQPDQVHPPPQPLTQLALLERRDPQRRNEITAAQLGQHARVDPVGLARKRRDAFTRRASATSTCQPAERAGHAPRPRRSSSRRTPSRRFRAAHQPREPVLVSRREPLRADRTAADFAHHAARVRPIDSDILRHGASFLSDCVSKRPLSRASGRPSFMTFHATGRRRARCPDSDLDVAIAW